MKTTAALLTICVMAIASTPRFDCGNFWYDLLQVNSSVVNQETCCTTREKTCANIGCDKVKENYSSRTAPTFENCCEAQCGEIRPGRDRYKCPNGFMFGTGREIKELSASSANCCRAYQPTCLLATRNAPEAPFDLFPCASGTVLNGDKIYSTTVTQANCCKPFSPTCIFNSGSFEGLDMIPFDCASLGKATNTDSLFQPSSEGTCCKPFTSNCFQPNVNSPNPFQCPAFKVLKDYKTLTMTTNPSEYTCCGTPTCNNARDETCGYSLFKEYCETVGLNVDPSNADVKFVHKGVSMVQKCCSPRVSGAERTIPALIVGVFVLLF